jgi:hypothetical protein
MNTTHDLPKAIRVAAYDIKVINWDTHTACANRRFGEFCALEFCIRVDATVDPMKVLNTLIHEINHAVYWAYGLEDEDKEERVVSTMAIGWTQIYRDNPHLIRWIEATSKPKQDSDYA